MAKMHIYQSIENGIFVVSFKWDPTSFSDVDKQLMAKYGEPVVNVGGTFLASTGNQFILPDTFKRVVTDFPHTQRFDPADSRFTTNIQTKASAYRTELMATITAAFTTLRANNDTYTQEIIQDNI